MQAATVAIRELPAGETHFGHQAMRELRPAYGDERAFVEHVDTVLLAKCLAGS
jgi:hypothetical protein